MDNSERISTMDAVASHELRLSLKIVLIIAVPARTEDLGVGDGDVGIGRVGGGEIGVGMLVSVFVEGGGSVFVVGGGSENGVC